MKLSYILLLALVAVVAADSYEHYQNSYPEEEHYQNSYPQEEGSPSRHSSRRRSGRAKAVFSGILKNLFGIGNTRRQFVGTGTGTGTGTGFTTTSFNTVPVVVAPATTGGITAASLAPFLVTAILFGLGIGALVLALSSLDFNSSGRGLDTDEWEVDHSVWMNQLQRDFEDSWSTE